MSSIIDEIRIIDSDTHVQEPPDLWSSRVPATLRDSVPQIRWSEADDAEVWFLGDQKLFKPGSTAMAGWPEYPPLGPKRFADIDPSMWDATQRLKKMDEVGIWAQVLYPNLATFNTRQFASDTDRDKHLLTIQVYNDFLTDWSSEAPDRLLPISAIPFWDLDAALAELARCKEMGHRGIMMSQNPAAFGLPSLVSGHWDPLWATAEELRTPVNFHIGTGDNSAFETLDFSIGAHAAYGSITLGNFVANANTISQLIFGGVCHRFPKLDFVSVESGVGWIPFALEAMDWQWLGSGVHKEHPEFEMLPSEYFKRQIYVCFWFEHKGVRLGIEEFEDNIFYETDFPHPTSMSPGPASPAVPPKEYLHSKFADLPDSTLRKVLHDNAARVYGLD